jgi:hypothetical protein
MLQEFAAAPYKLARQKSKDSQPWNRSQIVIEPTPEQAEEQRAARDVEVQQRGGHLHDTIKIDPFTKSYMEKERGVQKPIIKA